MKKKVDLTDFDIKFVGLKVGKHDFQFDIDSDFIAKFQDSLIDKLELIVDNEKWPLPKYRELLFVR